MQSRTNVHYLVFHLTTADTIISFITMPMEITWRMFIEVRKMVLRMLGVLRMMMVLKMLGMVIMLGMMMTVAVARWERGLQGFYDDPDRGLSPFLTYACRTQC